MLIMTQDRKCLFNLEMAGDLHLSSHYGGYEEGKPVKVLASLLLKLRGRRKEEAADRLEYIKRHPPRPFS